MPSNTYKQLLKDLHCAIDTGNQDEAREVLQHILHANSERTITAHEVAGLLADYHLAFPDA